MNTEIRRKIIERFSIDDKTFKDVLAQFLRDELFYSEWNIKTEKGGEEEIKKICQAYGITETEIPETVLPLVNRIRNWKPSWGVCDHYDINDSVSYIVVYYDREPTAKYRKKGRYPIAPIEVDDSTFQK